jgi:hypothetical protein
LSELDPQVPPQKLHLLLQDAMAALPEMKRPSKMVSRGYFEQGIVTGAIMVLGGAALGLSACAYYAFRFWRSR